MFSRSISLDLLVLYSDFKELALDNAKEYMWAISVMTGGDDFLRRAGKGYEKNHGGKKRPLADKLEKFLEILWSKVRRRARATFGRFALLMLLFWSVV